MAIAVIIFGVFIMTGLVMFSLHVENVGTNQRLVYYHQIVKKMVQIQQHDIAYLNCLAQPANKTTECIRPDNEFGLSSDHHNIIITTTITVHQVSKLITAIKLKHDSPDWGMARNLALAAINHSPEVGMNKSLGEYTLMNDSTYVFKYARPTTRKIML